MEFRIYIEVCRIYATITSIKIKIKQKEQNKNSKKSRESGGRSVCGIEREAEKEKME